jgi:hypothetical protein
LLALVIAGCGGSDKPQDLIIGTWESTQPDRNGQMVYVRTEWTKDGKVKLVLRKDMILEGQYTFLEENTVETELTVFGKTITEKMKIESISKGHFVVINPEGKRQNTPGSNKLPKKERKSSKGVVNPRSHGRPEGKEYALHR